MPSDPAPAPPFSEPPPPGGTVAVADGVLWLRLALPFLLDHVNVYLLEEPGGWALLDCGLGDQRTRDAWAPVLARHHPTRLLVTHCHPDHAGLAGWLCEQHGLALHMPATEYDTALRVARPPEGEARERHLGFYIGHGFDAATAARIAGDGHAYLRATTGLPARFAPLRASQAMTLGGRQMQVLTGGGHAPEQAMLLDPAGGLFFSADQILDRISPNIGVWWSEPDADPLGDYLESLHALESLPDDALVLPGHGLPFYGVQARRRALLQHHAERCSAVVAACRGAPRTVAEITPGLFRRVLDPHQMGFAFREILAHVNRLVREERLRPVPGEVARFVAA